MWEEILRQNAPSILVSLVGGIVAIIYSIGTFIRISAKSRADAQQTQNQINSTFATLSQKIYDTMEEERKGLSEEIRGLRERIAELQEEIDRLQQVISNMQFDHEKALSECENEVRQWKVVVAEKEQEILSLQTRIEELENNSNA